MKEEKKKPSKEVTLNLEQGLFVIPHFSTGKRKRVVGYSCLGFEVCYRWSVGIINWLEKVKTQYPVLPISESFTLPENTEAAKGSLNAYNYYKLLCSYGSTVNQLSGLRCDAELTPELIGVEGKIVEVVTSYGETERFKVGKSSGWMPCHIAFEKNSHGGAVVGSPFKSLKIVNSW